MATLTLSKIEKTYPNGFKAIHGIDLDIRHGEMVVLVGPSGCGKSTLLRMIAGLETVSSGEMYINNTQVNDVEPGDRDIAMVFQNYALYPHMTVYNNMAYGLKNRKISKAEIEQKVTATAKMLELDHLLDRNPKQLSGGQRQRVAMGRAIVRHPKIFLFDEPLSNLDAKLRVQMRLEIKKLQRRLDTTSVYVTHDQVEAMTLADRLVVLNGGNVEQLGSPLEVYDKPASVFVATFIGSPSMNILPATYQNHSLLLEGSQQISVPEQQTYPTGQVQLGLRPEHLIVSERKTSLTVTVEMVESLGADLLVYCTLSGTKSQLVVRMEGHTKLNEGQTLYLSIAAENLHVFDHNSGLRLVSEDAVQLTKEERLKGFDQAFAV